jgi:hypothetical protein
MNLATMYLHSTIPAESQSMSSRSSLRKNRLSSDEDLGFTKIA